MASTGKLLVLATVGGVALILGTVALGLTLLLNQRTALKLKNTPNTKAPPNTQQHQRSIAVEYYNQKLDKYKTYGPNPTSKELSSEGHFRLAIELFDGSFPLGEFEEKEASPFVAAPSIGISSYMTSVGDLRSVSLSSLIQWGSTHIGNTKAKIQKSASRRRQMQRRKRRGHKSEIEDMAWEHLRKAAELGHADAQYILGNAFVSGLFWGEATSSMTHGGRNVSLGLANWHMAAIGGNIEAAVNLGFRYFSADEKSIEEDYGVAVLPGQQCKMANAYYEEAAHGIMDVLEAGPSRGKVTPAIDRHKLSEIYVAGTSSSLAGYNKPDELQEALEYYRLRALNVDKSNPSSMDVHAALTLAQFHHYGLRGVLQDLNQALKFYEIAAIGGNREAAGQAGIFHFFGIGYDDYSNVTSFTAIKNVDGGPTVTTPFDETLHPIQFGNLYKAHEYLTIATSTGIEDCYRRKKRESEDSVCDAEGLNGMGLLHLFGLPGVFKKNRSLAIRYFQLAKESGSVDATFHLALVYMGWMKQPVPMHESHSTEQPKVEEEEPVREIYDEPRPTKSISLQDMKFMDADGNAMAFEEMAALLGPNGMDLLNQLGDHFDGMEGFDDIELDIDGDVMIDGDENVPPRVRGVLQKIALAAAKGAGKVDDIDGQLKDGSQFKIHTKVIYADKDGSFGDPAVPFSSNSHPTKSDYERAIQHLSVAASNLHMQAAHRLATIYSHGIQNPQNPGQYLISKNCQASLRLFKQVTENAPHVSIRSRRAYKQYMNGDVTSSLLNYLVLAEGGSEVGQLNAAWLLEQGYCLNMSKRNCLRASLRMWRAAARQGSSEASLRVGDFYYYGKMSLAEQEQAVRDDELFDIDNEVWYYTLKRWILYPEQMIKEGRIYLRKYIKQVLNSNKDSPPSQTCIANDDKTCPVEEETSQDNNIQQDMTTAAMYYRKAAQSNSNSRANFNLGYMHEWGLGLKQDFPLAKRHYDLARSSNRDAFVVIQIALFSMNVHEKAINLMNFCKRWWEELDDEFENDLIDEDASIWKRGGYRFKVLMKEVLPKTYHPRWNLIMSHMLVLDWEMFGIICLSLVLIKFLMTLRQRRV